MLTFPKGLLTGACLLLLLTGNGIANRPVLNIEPFREPAFGPSTSSALSEPFTHSRLLTFNIPPEHVSIANLLSNRDEYHRRLIAVRGVVTQPELHLDESELFINFVFRLADGEQSMVIFGRHDRTQGALSISLDLSVEVIGVFWKERDLAESHIINTIEALTVAPYPPLIPENA
jgi:hypothetical protein